MLFMGSHVHDSFLMRLQGLELLPGISSYDQPMDDISITSAATKKKKTIKESQAKLKVERLDSLINLQSAKSILDSSTNSLYCCSGFGTYNYITKIFSKVPQESYEKIEFEDATFSVMYSDNRKLVLMTQAKTNIFNISGEQRTSADD
jgi:hypothetical protein